MKQEKRYLVFICPRGSKSWILGVRDCEWGDIHATTPAVFGAIKPARAHAKKVRETEKPLFRGEVDPNGKMDAHIVKVLLPGRQWDARGLAAVKELKQMRLAECKKTNKCRNGCILPRKCKRT